MSTTIETSTDTLACGCPADTHLRQVDEHNVQCTGCGLVSA